MHKILQEFRDFISRGNVVDMAVGVIVGGAFSSIVKSLTTNLINPLLGLFVGKIDFSALVLTVEHTQFRFGSFINAIINFLIIAFIVFLLVKGINKIEKMAGAKEKAATVDPQVAYLKDIRDLLINQAAVDEDKSTTEIIAEVNERVKQAEAQSQAQKDAQKSK